jgi:6-phosphofructokinase
VELDLNSTSVEEIRAILEEYATFEEKLDKQLVRVRENLKDFTFVLMEKQVAADKKKAEELSAELKRREEMERVRIEAELQQQKELETLERKAAEKQLAEKERRHKLVNLIVVAEGDDFGGANEVGKIITERLPMQDVRVCILGHIQRGGSPSCFDRLIASRMGYSAVECLLEGRHNVFVGIVNNRMHYTPLNEAVKKKQRINEEWMKIVKILAS